jgi:hypothetical protein
MGWVSPTGNEDPDSKWAYETRAYDENTGTCATCNSVAGWNAFIILTHAAIQSNKLQFNAYRDDWITAIDVDVSEDGVSWTHVYQGDYANMAWVEKTFTQQSVTKVRIRFYATAPDIQIRLYEFDFWEVAGVAHTKTVSEILGLVDGKSTKTAFHRTKSEVLGLVDGYDKNRCKKCKPSSVTLTF